MVDIGILNYGNYIYTYDEEKFTIVGIFFLRTEGEEWICGMTPNSHIIIIISNMCYYTPELAMMGMTIELAKQYRERNNEESKTMVM